MSENVLVLPATFAVGGKFPPYLPLADGSVKAIAECSKEEVKQAVEEVKALADGSRARLQQAFDQHVLDLETLAHLSAYLAKYDEWANVREGGEMREILWHDTAVAAAPGE